MGSVGSRASRMNVRIGSPRRSVRNEWSATPSDIASKTNAPASTKNAPGEATYAGGSRNLCTASQMEKAPPTVKSIADTTNAQKYVFIP